MGQLGDVAHNVVAADVLAHGEGHRGGMVCELAGLDNVPDAHGGNGAVGHLDAHGGDLVWHRGDADTAGAQRQSDVVLQVGDLTELDALVQGKLIAGDAGAVDDLAGLGVHAEGAEGIRQASGVVAQLGAHLGVVAAAVLLQQGDGRVTVGDLALRQLLLDGVADLLGGGLHLLLELGLLLLVAEGLGRCRRLDRRSLRRGGGRLLADRFRGRHRRAQHLVGGAHVVAAPGEEGCGGRDDHVVLLAVQGDVDIGAPALFGRRFFLRGCFGRGKVRGQVVILVLVLLAAQALAIAADALGGLLRRQVQRSQQGGQQQHHEHDDGHHLAQQRLAAHGQTAGHNAAAAQRLSVRPQGLYQSIAEGIGRAAQGQMTQHAHQQRQQCHAGGAQYHRAALMPQLDDRHGGQPRRRQIITVAQGTPEDPGDPGQQEGVHIEIAHQHAERQQGADDTAHQTRRGVVGRRRRGRGRLFAGCGLLLCRCHSLPHLMPCRTRVRTPAAQQ